MNNKTRGYVYVLSAVAIFAIQDAFSKFLGEKYPPIMVTMIRFWAFAIFVTVLAARSRGGLRRAIVTEHPVLQVVRGVLLVSEIVVVIFSFTITGLAMSQTVLQATPLFVTILSVPLLGEKVGWRRGLAVLVGLVGILILLNPVNVHFDARLLLPLGAGFMYALYGVGTRAVSRTDSAVTSVFYVGVAGAVTISVVGPFYWTPMAVADWPAMAALCVSGALSHFLLIKSYTELSAVEIQPLTYLQLVLSIGIAVLFFGETITWNMIVGAVIVVAAGLFTVWREYRLGLRKPKAI
jgi:drug/metabolite transporter (DMT)-like permease